MLTARPRRGNIRNRHELKVVIDSIGIARAPIAIGSLGPWPCDDEAFAFPELCCGGAFSSATAATRLQFDLRTSFRGTLWRATKPHILISNLMPPAFCARVVSQPDARSSSRLASCVSFQSRARAAALLQVGCCFCGGSAMGPFGSWLRVSREPKNARSGG